MDFNVNRKHKDSVFSALFGIPENLRNLYSAKEYNEYLSLEESVTNAVKYCLEQNVLKEFLEEHGTEVINMLFDDISIEEIAAIRYNEGREQGRE
ncbi:MAG: hypothetical protein FWC03_06045 [Treponema sp.]|nr:hypothetical protein [Treponema sp.]